MKNVKEISRIHVPFQSAIADYEGHSDCYDGPG
jgi:hypothetical protein